MPYYKQQQWKKPYRRRYQRKKPTRWQNYQTGLSQLASDVGKLKNLINVEFKYHDKSQGATVTDQDGDVYPLNYVDQGDGDQTRDGSMFRMKSLELKYLLSLDEDNTTTPRVIRIMLILDTDPNGSQPSISDFLDQTTRPTLSPRNLNNRSRFVFLMDKYHTLSPGGNEVAFRKVFKQLDYKVQFDNATASATALKKNGLYLCAISNAGSADLDKPFHSFDSRVRFIDN